MFHNFSFWRHKLNDYWDIEELLFLHKKYESKLTSQRLYFYMEKICRGITTIFFIKSLEGLMIWSASSGEAYHITTLEKTFFRSLGHFCHRHGAWYGFHPQLFLSSNLSLPLLYWSSDSFADRSQTKKERTLWYFQDCSRFITSSSN